MRRLAIVTILLASCSNKTAEQPPQPSGSAPAEKPPEPMAPPTAEPVETGQKCITATSLCEGGSCTVKLKNDCDQAQTCDGFVTVRCRTNTEAVEARGRGRQTVAAKTEGELVIGASCTMGNRLIGTELSELKCK